MLQAVQADAICHHYGKWPHELLSLSVEEYTLTLSIYLHARGEEARNHWWETSQRKAKSEGGG